MDELARQYADEFPIKREHVYFDHAAVCPLPRRSALAAQQVLQGQAEHGDILCPQWERELQEVRRDCARLVRAAPEEIAFVRNTSHGLMVAAGSIPWREGDNVITSSREFPANVYPWLGLERQGVETRFIGMRGGRLLMDDLVAAMDRRTRAVALSWVQFSNGFRADLGKLSQLCRDRDCYLVLDAIQGLGALQLDLSRYSVDFASADGHKWLLGVEGAGMLYVRRQILDELVPFSIGWLGVDNPFDFLHYELEPAPAARRFEEGSRNVVGLHALGASVRLLLEAGPERVERAVLELTDALCERLEELGCLLTSSRGANERSGIVTFEHPRAPAGEIVGHLQDHGVACAERLGAVRLSPHFYNDSEELERVVALIAELTGTPSAS